MGRAAIEEARALGDEALIRDVLLVAGSALISYVPPREAHAMAVELFERARACDDLPLMLRAAVRRVVHAVEIGRLEAFGAETDELLHLAESVGLPSLSWRPLVVGSMRALAQGNFRESERLLGEVEELGALTDDPALAFGLMTHMAARASAIEDPAGMQRAREGYVRTLQQTGPQPYVRAQLIGHVALRARDRAGAAAELDELVRGAQDPPDAILPGIAGEIAAWLGNAEQQRSVQRVLEPMRGDWLVTSQVDFVFSGPIERVLGLLEHALGRHAAAIASFTHARALCERHGLRPWLARLDLELGHAQLAVGDATAARASWEAALAQAEALPLVVTAQRAREALLTLQAHGVSVPSSSAPPPSAAAQGQARETAAAPKPRVQLEQRGNAWRAEFAGREVLLKDSRGVQLLARLIAAPRERVHVLALASDEGGAALGESHAGAALDATALKRYRTRLAELDEEIAAAENTDDATRAEQLQDERDALTTELRRAVGLGGRLRKVGSVTERARVNVTRRLRDAIARVSEAHPELGRYLTDSIRTGTYCSFRP
jgi:tetratricopeptide (TPR) repeat protein